MIGLLATSTGPLFYIIFKLCFGGLYKIDPVKYPINQKTKLALGDIWRLGYYFIITGAFAFLGKFFLVWYEGDWGAEYYAEEWGSGLFSNFGGMLNALMYGGAAVLIIGLLLVLAGKKAQSEKEIL